MAGTESGTAAAVDRAFDVVSTTLADLQRRLAGLTDGEVADYIPPPALADPADFGLALVSLDGHRYQAGDSGSRFAIQSASKPFVYALVLAELGLEETTRWVGAEPTGEPFNAISLEPGTGRPANPMVNAGAIATTNLVPAHLARGSAALGRAGLPGARQTFTGAPGPIGIPMRYQTTKNSSQATPTTTV